MTAVFGLLESVVLLHLLLGRATGCVKVSHVTSVAEGIGEEEGDPEQQIEFTGMKLGLLGFLFNVSDPELIYARPNTSTDTTRTDYKATTQLKYEAIRPTQMLPTRRSSTTHNILPTLSKGFPQAVVDGCRRRSSLYDS
jgi:hypothetical protein